MIIDCDGCQVRGDACGDCVVAVLLGAPPELQADEQHALGVLAEAGLIPPLRLVAADSVPDSGTDLPTVTSTTPSVTSNTPGSHTEAV
jgi:hypothetical protein